MFACGSAETCGTEELVDIQLDIRDPNNTQMAVVYAYDGYGFIDASAEAELSESPLEGDYTSNVQAWLGDEHVGCYDAKVTAGFKARSIKIQAGWRQPCAYMRTLLAVVARPAVRAAVDSH